MSIEYFKELLVIHKKNETGSPLAYMTANGTDKAAESRKATGIRWSGGENSAVLKTFQNVPVQGFAVVNWRGRYTTDNKVMEIQDPRGFKLQISIENFFEVLQEATITKGAISEKCIWLRDTGRNVLAVLNDDVQAKIDSFGKVMTLTDGSIFERARNSTKYVMMNTDRIEFEINAYVPDPYSRDWILANESNLMLRDITNRYCEQNGLKINFSNMMLYPSSNYGYRGYPNREAPSISFRGDPWSEKATDNIVALVDQALSNIRFEVENITYIKDEYTYHKLKSVDDPEIVSGLNNDFETLGPRLKFKKAPFKCTVYKQISPKDVFGSGPLMTRSPDAKKYCLVSYKDNNLLEYFYNEKDKFRDRIVPEYAASMDLDKGHWRDIKQFFGNLEFVKSRGQGGLGNYMYTATYNPEKNREYQKILFDDSRWIV